ncbi:MAG: ribosomal protein L7/L12 [Gemmataceae bacterium]|nr:ribosomal protein L7/L12 [Gemmataceae bacterium]
MLKANPADDTARLVYADWLDEHDQPQKAEYLRLVVHYAQALHAAEEIGAESVNRLDALSGVISADWRCATAARFSLVLESYEPTKKINAIKLVREMTGMGLAEAKEFVETTPSGFLFRITPEGGEGLKRHFGAGRLRVSPDIASVLKREPTAGIFRVYAYLSSFDWGSDDLPPEARAAFRKFLTDVGEEPGLAESDVGIELRPGLDLTYSRAQAELQRCSAFLPPDYAERSWTIILYANPQLPSIR